MTTFRNNRITRSHQNVKLRCILNYPFRFFSKKLAYIKLFIFVFVFTTIMLSCSAKQIHTAPERKLSFYPALYHLPVHQRIATPPDHLLEYLKNLDGREDYKVFIPDQTASEKIKLILPMLPPLNIRALNEGVSAIYFIENFMGSGMTDWLIDEKGKLHTYMILNPDVLRLTMSELLTKKERSAFVNSMQSIIVTPDDSALLYILLHESVHVADYLFRITDCVEDTVCNYQNRNPLSESFDPDVWRDINHPLRSYSFTGKVHFYGLGRKYAEDPLSIYNELLKSPFISLYASLSRAEDLADLLTFYHLTHVLKKDYLIKLHHEVFSPLNNPVVKKRFPKLKIFYASSDMLKK